MFLRNLRWFFSHWLSRRLCLHVGAGNTAKSVVAAAVVEAVPAGAVGAVGVVDALDDSASVVFWDSLRWSEPRPEQLAICIAWLPR